MSLIYFPCLFYGIDMTFSFLILGNWLTEKIICCFISRSFSGVIMKCLMSETICKLLSLKLKLIHLWEYEENCYFLKLELLHLWEYLKNCYFFTESAAFPGKSTNLLLLV